MCSGAIYWAGIVRVVFGCTGAALGEISGEELNVACRDVFASGKLHRIETIGPVLAEEADAQHRNYWDTWSGEHFGTNDHCGD